ncbi:MAG TPA: lysylphosphatidylglycerol synthase transmembrane domain-containing protein [Gemmatimonadaceae bacterium]|nr:lysylphosphatidylglycerol synthase transmembrane domain-containing protein [Gemmatimonadaceae bacterium]
MMSWRSLLGFVLSAALLVLTLYLGDVDPAAVREHLRSANLGLLLLSGLVATSIFPMRARRWRTLLDPVAPDLPFGVLWRPTAIGMMVTNVVPARAGEIARAFALTRETPRVGFSAALASIALDRVFDAFVVLLLMLVAMLDPSFPGDRVITGGWRISTFIQVSAVLVVVALAMLYLIVLFPERLIAIYASVARRMAPRFERRGRTMLESFASGLGALRSPRRALIVFLWTMAHWLTNGFAFWIAFRAVGIDAPFSAALVLQGIVAIGVAIPSAPGFFGVFEAFGTAGLAIYGISASLAVTWAIGFHIVSYIPITLLGGYYFARLGLHFRELRQAPESPG